MRRVLIPVLALVFCLTAAVSAAFSPSRAAQEVDCAGSWLIQITLDGRDDTEDALIALEDGGAIEVYGPPVMPALPGSEEVPLQASSGLGTWQSTGNGECAFEYVRLLADDDGVSVGTLNVRGLAAVDGAGTMDGSLTIVRSTGFGQTAATSDGAFSGTTLDGPLLWLTPTSAQSLDD